VACTIGACGGAGIDCILKCFNNDLRQAIDAVNAVQCVYGTCGMSCVGGANVEAPFSFEQ
jgi:hypothetical protein